MGNYTSIQKGVYSFEYNDLLNDSKAINMDKLPPLLGRFLCWLGFHDYRVISKTFEFGTSGVEKSECRRCGIYITRRV